MAAWADDPNQPWTELKFDQFGFHATVAVKTIQALYYKAGCDRLLTIVLVHDLEGKRPDQMFYCTKLDWTARQILSAYACRWAIEISHPHSVRNDSLYRLERSGYRGGSGVAGNWHCGAASGVN